jgi:Family of unknown function (DUF6011)
MTTATLTAPTTHDAIILDADQFNHAIHDGMITISNPARGTHRTFAIETMAKDAKFAPGKRVVRLLIGSDRDDYTAWKAFAFADQWGVQVWRKYEGTEFETLANMLANPRRWAAKGAEYLVEVTCRRCGRPLTHPESIQTGLGPVCAGKV